MKMNLKTISFIFIIGLTLSYQDDVVTTADEDSEINAKSLLSEELPNENEEVGKESTDVKNEEPNTDVDFVKPPDLNAQRAKFYAAPGEGLGHFVDFDYESNYDSLTSRFAPKPADLNHYHGIPHILTEARLKEIREPLLYWFFDKGGNDGNGDFQTDIHSSIPQVHKNFNFQVPFFGFRFNYTRVSMNGYLEFSDPPPYYKYPLVFPIKDWPKQNDPSFIGIFFSKCRIGAVRPEDVDQRAAGVYYRVERDLQSRTDTFGTEVRERVMWDIRTGVIGSETFIPKHVVIVTWKNMTFAGGIENTLFKTNTFQMVLATDEVFTYVLFNYADLQWSSHTEAGGDTTGGEGGIPAFIGFNAGNGTQSFSYEPYSQNSVLRDLVGRGWGNGKRGRHIFRIDEKIMLGTCNKDWSGSNLPLIFAPESGNMLGGTVVNITGPCFEDPNIKIICRFDTEEVRGFIIDRNRAICIQPRIFAEGYIRFEVALGSGGYNWKGKYFVETPATATERIFFESSEIHNRDANEFKITWDPKNLTTNQNAIVRISLWGYREISIKPELEYIDIIEESTSNAGVYLISPSNFRLRDNRFQRDMHFGFIQINLTNPDQYSGMGITPVLWSRPIPLGWYFKPQWEKQYGRKWPEALCNKWLMNDRYLKNFAHEIPQCPCKLSQALNDKGRFLPDFDCDKDINSKCLYNKGAIHCVRTGAPSLDGAEQQCCYDKHNYLMLSYDQQWGSRPRRSHNLGYIPWTEANKVPTLSHWFHDMSPFYSCCMWQDEQSVGCETYRFERRPSQDCIAYQAPGVATTFGDPHFVTFDNLPYTFNGKGEFVLVRSNSPKTKLDVQGRFEQIVPNRYGEVKATQLSSVVARGNNSAVIEVRLRPRDAQWRYRLDVLADGKRVYFDRPSLKVQHFVGVTVYTPTYILNQSEVILMFESGAGVEVIENEGFMTTRVYLPWNFINKTRGLFGNWSFDPQDDFTNPDGTFAAVGNINSFERIHKDFAINWLLEDKEDDLKGRALFTREFGLSASVYANRTFEPEWKMKAQEIIPTNRSYEIEKAKNLCSDNYQCEYDYAVTLNRDMAHFTKNYFNTYTKIRQESEERVISCGILETPRFGRKSNFLFIPGTKVAFECNQDFILIGDQRRTCMPDGQWDLPEYGYTECLRMQEYSSRQAGLTFGIIMAVLLPLVLCLVCVGYRVLKSRRETREEEEREANRNAQLLLEHRRLQNSNTEDAYKVDKSDIEPTYDSTISTKGIETEVN